MKELPKQPPAPPGEPQTCFSLAESRVLLIAVRHYMRHRPPAAMATVEWKDVFTAHGKLSAVVPTRNGKDGPPPAP